MSNFNLLSDLELILLEEAAMVYLLPEMHPPLIRFCHRAMVVFQVCGGTTYRISV